MINVPVADTEDEHLGIKSRWDNSCCRWHDCIKAAAEQNDKCVRKWGGGGGGGDSQPLRNGFPKFF